jgi:hypothetical protein
MNEEESKKKERKKRVTNKNQNITTTTPEGMREEEERKVQTEDVRSEKITVRRGVRMCDREKLRGRFLRGTFLLLHFA